MSKRVCLKAEMGTEYIDVGWIEITPTGRILEAYFPDPIARVTSGGTHNDTRCAWCEMEACVDDLMSDNGEDCLCCRSNHGHMDPNKPQKCKRCRGDCTKGYPLYDPNCPCCRSHLARRFGKDG